MSGRRRALLREALGLSLLIAGLRRGGLRRISHLSFRLWPLVILAALLQALLPFTGANLGEGAALFALVLSYLLILFALYENRDSFWLRVAALGVALNFAAIVSNGGMPVSLRPLGEIHGRKSVREFQQGSRDFVHVPLANNSRLRGLSDIIPLRPPYPLPNIISIGDVILSVGVFCYLERGSRYSGRRVRSRRRSRVQGRDPSEGPELTARGPV